MSDGTKFKTKGGSGKRGGGKRNNSCNNNQPKNNSDSHTNKPEELETATYIVIHFSLADRYKKVTKEIIRYVIINLPARVHLSSGIYNSKLPNMSLDPKPKQYKKSDGTSAVYDD